MNKMASFLEFQQRGGFDSRSRMSRVSTESDSSEETIRPQRKKSRRLSKFFEKDTGYYKTHIKPQISQQFFFFHGNFRSFV